MSKHEEIKKQVADIQKEIFAQAKVVFTNKKKECAQMGVFINHLVDSLNDSIEGGKSIRGALVYQGGKAVGSQHNKQLIKLALAMELIHSYFLIHDDIVDKDEVRRGKPSFHKYYENSYQSIEYNPSDKHHFGISMGIFGGDMLIPLAYEIANKLNYSAEKKLKIIQTMSQAIFTTNCGQVLDFLNEIKTDQPTDSDVLRVHTLKTGYYTMAAPITIGALAGGASEAQIKMLHDFALPLGIAFQVKDDMLGVFGDQTKTGKSSYNDIKEGKQTMLIVQALKKARYSDKKIIDKYLGNPDLTEQQAERVKEIIEQTGSRQYSVRLCEKLIHKALSKLDESIIDQNAAEFLKNLATYIVEREK